MEDIMLLQWSMVYPLIMLRVPKVLLYTCWSYYVIYYIQADVYKNVFLNSSMFPSMKFLKQQWAP
jgi:hypothetical protein